VCSGRTAIASPVGESIIAGRLFAYFYANTPTNNDALQISISAILLQRREFDGWPITAEIRSPVRARTKFRTTSMILATSNRVRDYIQSHSRNRYVSVYVTSRCLENES